MFGQRGGLIITHRVCNHSVGAMTSFKNWSEKVAGGAELGKMSSRRRQLWFMGRWVLFFVIYYIFTFWGAKLMRCCAVVH
jgi:hypothetical protein